MPLGGALALGSASTLTPGEFLYTGVMENIYANNWTPIVLSDLDPGIIRTLRGEDNPLGSAGSVDRTLTIPRSIDIVNAGVELLPAIRTEFSSTAAFTDYLTAWIEALDSHSDNPPLWWECGNEPAPPPGSGMSTATVRANYYTKMAAASTVLAAHGKKLIMTAWTGQAGGTDHALEDLHDHVSGATPAMVDGMAIHPYTVYAADTGNNNGSYTSVQGYRNLFDGVTDLNQGYNGDLDNKPLFITEIGWSCANRADGQQHGDWAGQAPEMLSTDISISQATQANNLSVAFNDLKNHRAKSDLYLKAVIYFCFHDYGIPNENWDRHCGLVDTAGGKRSAYTTLKSYPRSFTIGP